MSEVGNNIVDENAIAKFLTSNQSCPIVAIQGLGFVGAVMSLVCANALNGEYAVIGVERDTDAGRRRVDLLNNGTFPLAADDPKIEEYYQAAQANGNFLATVNQDAYALADVVIVDINLDVRKESDSAGALNSFAVELEPFTAAIETIGRVCKPDALILVETTVPPGTCKQVVAPVIRRCLAERGLPTDQIRIGHSYERVMPGPQYIDSIQSFYRVYSGVDQESADAVESFLRTIIRTDEYPLTRLRDTNATEIAKVLENSYRAMNIAFVVEWSRMAEEAGVDLYEVVRAIRQRPTHANLMFPGIGVGGYCLTKDPLLASWSRTNLLGGEGPLPQSETAVSINDRMPHYAMEYLARRYPRDLEGRTVVLLGVSYRGDVGDTRFSPVEPFYRYLRDAGAHVTTHDPFVRTWDELDLEPVDALERAISSEPEIVVITTGHSVYRRPETIDALLALKPAWIYDTIGLLSAEQIVTLREKHTVIVLGRGDL